MTDDISKGLGRLLEEADDPRHIFRTLPTAEPMRSPEGPEALAYTFPWYDRIAHAAAGDKAKPWDVERWKTYIGKNSYPNRPAFLHAAYDEATTGYRIGDREMLGMGLLKGVAGSLGPAWGALEIGGRALRGAPAGNALKGLMQARDIASENNRRASATGWSADNVVVPTQGGRYEMGAGGSWRIPWDSKVTSEQLAAFKQMPKPDKPLDTFGVLPKYESPHRPPTTAEQLKWAKPEERKKIEDLQNQYLQLWGPGKGEKPN